MKKLTALATLAMTALFARGEFVVAVDASRPCPGLPLKAVVSGHPLGEVSFVWTRRSPAVDERQQGTLSESDEYVPSEADYEHWIRVVATDGEGLAASAEFYFSKLPVVYIDTDDGKPVTEKSVYKGATIRIQGNDSYEPQYDGRTEIKGRGNTSWSYPKKPYKLKLDKSADLFGFGKNKHWVLLANWLDECFLRNYLAQDLAGELGLVKDEMTWVNVVLNGVCQGNYMLAEHIRVGKNRVGIFDWSDIIEGDGHSEEDLSWLDGEADVDFSGGYVFELSNEYDEVSKFTTARGVKVMVNTPEYAMTSRKMADYVTGLWGDFENAYCSEDGYNAKGSHYSEISDLSSMVAYWLVMETLGNHDAVWKSRYAYKDRSGKLIWGPVWDFDYDCGSVMAGADGSGWKVTRDGKAANFLREWADDPYFCLKAQESYVECVRPWLVELLQDGGTYDRLEAYLAAAGASDDELWGPASGRHPYFSSRGLAQRGFAGDVRIFREYLRSRLEWLDAQFSSIDALVTGVKTSASASPYKKDDSALPVSVLNGCVTGLSDAKTDFVLNEGESVPRIRVQASKRSIVGLRVYVNGIQRGIYEVSGGECVFSVPADWLSAERGHRDMVALIAKNASGKTIARNYLTVLNSKVFTVAFDSQGGTPVPAMRSMPGDAIVLPRGPVRTGFVFTGWFEPGSEVQFACDRMPERDVALQARWREDDRRIVVGSKLEVDTGFVGYKASGLPKGLKFNANTGLISGTPSKPGDYEIVLKRTVSSGERVEIRIPISVGQLPEAAVGTFNGFVMHEEGLHGSFTLTSGNTGKLAAKVVTAAGTISLSGSCWDLVTDEFCETTLATKKGERMVLRLDRTAAWDANQISGTLMTAAEPSRTYSVSAQRNAFGATWYFAATGDEASGWSLAFAPDAKAAALRVSLKANGATAVSGKLGAYKISASGVANVGMMKRGAIAADFAPVVKVNKVKRTLDIRLNLWFDLSNGHVGTPGEGVGEAKFQE